MEKYDRIGENYDETRKADPFILQKITAHLEPKTDGTYLDIGCGSGNYTAKLYQKGYRSQGVDPSELMINSARKKYPDISWKIGNAETLNQDTESIHGILATLTIHHWGNLQKAFGNLDRILGPKGKMIIFTSTPNQMQGYWLNHYFPKMMQKSMAQMPSIGAIETSISRTALKISSIENYHVEPGITDFFLYAGKHRPEYYLDPDIRAGISSFSDLAYSNEVKQGLNVLSNDIATGRVLSIMKNYANTMGDYVFIVLSK